MRALILAVSAVAIGVWSLFCWAVYALLGVAGGLASANLGLLPFPPETVLWMVELMAGMGGAAVWIVWGLGVAGLVVVTLIPLAFIPRRDRLAPRPAGITARHDGPSAPTTRTGDPRSAEEIVAGVLGRRSRE